MADLQSILVFTACCLGSFLKTVACLTKWCSRFVAWTAKTVLENIDITITHLILKFAEK